MRLWLSLSVLALLSGCVHNSEAVSVEKEQNLQKKVDKLEKKYDKVIVVRAPPKIIKCPLPKRPDPLKRPLPIDSPKLLIDKLTIKLQEWVGYGDKVEKSCRK